MGIGVLLLLFMYVSSAYPGPGMYAGRVKILSETRFEPPIDTHLIEIVNNIGSLFMCAAICQRHIICRTGDYCSATKVCRLFETLTGAGNLQVDQSTSVLSYNYCINDQQMEPEYICTRSGTYNVQQMFDQLASATIQSLPWADRGAYADMHGIYTSSNAGDLSFFTFDGKRINQSESSVEITSVHPATRNGLVVVRYSHNDTIFYTNTGTPWEPHLVQTNNFSLPDSPYSCFTTSQYLYVTYINSRTPMTVHNLSTGSVIYTDQSGNSVGNRPVLALWKDTILILDQYNATEYNLNGTYKGTWNYFSGFQPNIRHYVHYDYAGRCYTCNSGGTDPGIYAFSLNGTQLAHGPTTCYRAFQVYITKEQAIFINIFNNSASSLQIINF